MVAGPSPPALRFRPGPAKYPESFNSNPIMSMPLMTVRSLRALKTVLLLVGLGLLLVPMLSNAGAPPWVIDDSAIKTQLRDAMDKVIAEKKVLDYSAISQKLERKSCPLVLPVPSNTEMSEEDLYRSASEGVLVMARGYTCKQCTKTHVSIASGFMLSESGACVTNYHVVDEPGLIGLLAMNRKGRAFAVKDVLAADKCSDLAILQLEGSDFHPLPLKRDEAVGRQVWVISHPSENFYTMSRGAISRYYLSCKCAKCLKEKGGQSTRMSITADFGQGSSGGPVLNKNGAVVGMVCATMTITAHTQNKDNTQMVIKSCIPASAILGVIEPTWPTDVTNP
jgi:S1-C subfamily serine protease